jgi:predicted methyltransferase
MIVTTAGRTNDIMVERAQKIAKNLKAPYVERKKLSTAKMKENYNDDILVVGKERNEIFTLNECEPIFFHPNSAMFRVKRVISGERDPFINVCKLSKGDSLLDCTLGLASDSIVASFTVGSNGRVVGLEANPYISFLVKSGLKEWQTSLKSMNDAMKRIDVINENYTKFLPTLDSNSFDVVYFDPMFDTTISSSQGIQGIKNLALHQTISKDIIAHAKRVAKRRVVIKNHWQSEMFDDLGFTVLKRPTAKFHYGFIDCN